MEILGNTRLHKYLYTTRFNYVGTLIGRAKLSLFYHLYNYVTTFTTRRSVEHYTLHANGAWLYFTGLSFRSKNDKVVPVYVGKVWKT